MDNPYTYAVIIVTAMGVFSMLFAVFLRSLKLTIDRNQKVIVAKQDALMKKLIEIKTR